MAGQFVDALWGDGLGWASVATLDGSVWREDFYRWPAERDDLPAYAMKAAATADVYVAPALRSQRRRTKVTAIPGPWAWADVDTASDEARDHLGLLGAMVVASGSPRSFHAYVPLAEVPEDVEELELWNRRLARYLGGDAKHDASAMLRLAGTFNRKAPTLPRPVALERLAGAPWSRDDLDDLLPLVEIVRPTTATVDLDALRAVSTRTLPIELLTLAAEVPGADLDRSRQHYRLVARACEYGLGEREVLALVSRHRPSIDKYGAGDRLMGETYRTLAKLRPAHDHIGRTCSAARCPTARAQQQRGRGR
jgi:RepB DNA-primase from phage plasmid